MSNEKEKLYYEAKQAYYNGEPIIGDVEFDELEVELGLENVAPVGEVGRTPNYTVKHPFIMGSLSKIQIKMNESGDIDWEAYYEELTNYVGHNNLIITPKYDGCSFELHVNGNDRHISSRGDGSFGKDLYEHLKNKLNINLNHNNYTLRGEVLINKEVFEAKYSEFTNPRSFVAGILGRKYEDIDDKSVLDDLTVVIYDYRYKEGEKWIDKDWTSLIGKIDVKLLPHFYTERKINNAIELKEVYYLYDKYRSECLFTLDGIVIKPVDSQRIVNLDKARPTDCVALKFLPTIKETIVTNVEWQLGKTGEYTPVVYFKEINIDGKNIIKASGHNYGNIATNGIGTGAVIRISLAGDIIPFIYEVVKSNTTSTSYPDDAYVDGCHLMKHLTLVDKMKIDFLASCKSLNITGIGDAQAEAIFDGLDYKVDHIFFVDDDIIRKMLWRGEGKTAENAVNAINEAKAKKTLTDVIASLNINDCGVKTAEQCGRYIISQELANFSGLSKVGYEWVINAMLPFDCDNEAHKNFERLKSILRHKDGSEEGHEFDNYMNDYKINNDGIKVILTGSPSNYKNKKEFIAKNPEYVETTKWDECQILFTGDINSTSSKMSKAKKLGIEIREY